jgi:hypothetical protein
MDLQKLLGVQGLKTSSTEPYKQISVQYLSRPLSGLILVIHFVALYHQLFLRLVSPSPSSPSHWNLNFSQK